MLLFSELLKLKEVDYVPLLMYLLDDDTKKQNKKNIDKPKKHIDKEMRKLEKQCDLLW